MIIVVVVVVLVLLLLVVAIVLLRRKQEPESDDVKGHSATTVSIQNPTYDVTADADPDPTYESGDATVSFMPTSTADYDEVAIAEYRARVGANDAEPEYDGLGDAQPAASQPEGNPEYELSGVPMYESTDGDTLYELADGEQ